MKRTASTRPLMGGRIWLGLCTRRPATAVRIDMTKLISALTVIVLSVATVSTAGQGGAMSRAAREARERDQAEARDRADRPYKGPKAYKRDAKRHRRDVKADERE